MVLSSGISSVLVVHSFNDLLSFKIALFVDNHNNIVYYRHIVNIKLDTNITELK